MTDEERRLEEARAGSRHWRRWGPYLSERQWGTVREDYSPDGDVWNAFTHDQARSRAYRWGEDGIAGISDEHQHLCFAVALWNGQDPILKERLFGLTGKEGNHGEDVKECYFYLDNVPSHAYMKYLYKYPQRAFPYTALVDQNRQRSRHDPEYELLDTGIFDDDRYFDVFIEYAKVAPDDVLISISAANRGPETAELSLLPTLWFRNTWSWLPGSAKPSIEVASSTAGHVVVRAAHAHLGSFWLYGEAGGEALFTENASNLMRLYGVPNMEPYVKDGINDFVVHGRRDTVNPRRVGTKASVRYHCSVGAGQTASVRLRLSNLAGLAEPFGDGFNETLARRRREADEFYRRVTPFPLPDDLRRVQRQAFAGLLWNKQYYGYTVTRWLDGDPAGPPPPEARRRGRNCDWWHLDAGEVLSVPDKWEYPWFAAWDTAFHAIPLAMIDPGFAKSQLLLLTREWYMHPNGQIPSYEWAFGDVTPPVHAWAALRVYQIEQKMYGRADRVFLERLFHKLLLNFTWWVNRKDAGGRNIFEGGFLGLDNVGVFNRSEALKSGERLEQADGTSWMAMYCLTLLGIALELAKEDAVYEDIATKFIEHFVYIGAAINRIGGHEGGLWDELEGYYFDALRFSDGRSIRIAAHTIVGLIPLFAVGIADRDSLDRYRSFGARVDWLMRNKPELLKGLADMTQRGVEERIRIALVDSDKLSRILERVLNEEGLLSPHGVRSVSKRHGEHPYVLQLDGTRFVLPYEPGESTSGIFGGNSNWRGPVWFPLNFLLIESLQRYHYFLGDDFRVECPAGSGRQATLWDVATELSRRLVSLFVRDAEGRRPAQGLDDRFRDDPHWRDLLLFHEYFHGDTGTGLGASHQTGWTGLVAKLIHQYGEYTLRDRPPLLAPEDSVVARPGHDR